MIQIDGIENTNKSVSKPEKTANKEKTALDVAKEVKGFIKAEYPQLADSHAMRLAILLTKAQTKDLI